MDILDSWNNYVDFAQAADHLLIEKLIGNKNSQNFDLPSAKTAKVAEYRKNACVFFNTHVTSCLSFTSVEWVIVQIFFSISLNSMLCSQEFMYSRAKKVHTLTKYTFHK